MTEVNVGDLIRATRKDDPSTKVEFEVTIAGLAYVENDWLAIRREDHDIEVMKRAFKLPTVPGLYTAATSIECVQVYRIFELTIFGNWRERGSIPGEAVGESLMKSGVLLRRLVIEDKDAARKAAEEAWNEGYETGVETLYGTSTPCGVPYDPDPNPYREEGTK